ncbi:polymer-forming cytoskeletal protein [bacterium SCSIO 12741]|nr:polymer-forming cytoskeletal protein [bacterium SCSIO 12741]
MARNGEGESGARNHIANGTKITGDIETNGDIRIDGILFGTVQSKGKVVVGSTGRIEGEIICQNANISGEVKGKVKVENLLSLQATARLHADIETVKLSIEPEAIFTGTCNMGAVIKDINQKQPQQAELVNG